MNYSTMTRKGNFTITEFTKNQCKKEGHSIYNYEIVTLFSSKLILDRDGFILDHIKVDSCIQNSKLKGSCEEICSEISMNLRKMYNRLKIPVIAICVKILADGDKSKAYITHFWIKNRNVIPLLPMIK